MSARAVLDAIACHATATPGASALRGLAGDITYAALNAAVDHTAARIAASAPRVIGLAMDNGPGWTTIDLAAMQSTVPLVPLPFFFSAGQLAHAIADAGIDCILTDLPAQFRQLLMQAHIAILSCEEWRIHGQSITEFRLGDVPAATLPAGTAKVTYTSGTTGSPKGVCLEARAMAQVALSLQAATEAREDDRHVSLLPLSTLLENIAGLYVPLLAGATAVQLPFAQIGLKGASGLDAQKMTAALADHAATTTILTPEMLLALVAAAEAGVRMPASLRFVAVGGAPVAARLIERARAQGIPVFEGYGLSECASVVALNTRASNSIGSVGRPLPHARLTFAPDGEILADGAVMLGYTGDAQRQAADACWPTGDLGYRDARGFLHITGRKKNIFITSFGRNVAPEWVERELTLYACIAQAAVFGESRPWNVAVIVPRGNLPESAGEIDRAIRDANRRLPDYAQIRRWIPAEAAFTPRNGQMTPNGRLRREAIRACYQDRIDHLYEENLHAVL